MIILSSFFPKHKQLEPHYDVKLLAKEQ